MLLPETTLEDGAVVAEKLRERVSRTVVDHEGARLTATISLGHTSYRWGEPLNLLLQRADSAMYTAKRLGRNRTAMAPDPDQGQAG